MDAAPRSPLLARWQLLLQATAQQMLGRVFSAAATFAALALSARALAPEGFAVIGAYLALWAILDVCIDGGSMSASLRAIAIEQRAERSAIRRAQIWRLVLLPVAYAVVIACAAFEQPALRTWILLSSLVLAAHLWAPRTLPLHRQLHLRPLAIARSIGACTTAMLVSALYLTSCSDAGPYLACFACGIATTAYLAYRAAPAPHADEPVALPAGPWIREALALGLAGLARTAYFWIDALLVRGLCSEEESGHYNAAYRLFNLALLVATCTSSSALPLLANAQTRERNDLRLVRRGLIVLGLALALLVSLGSIFWLRLAFGAEFEAGAPALRALCLGLAAVHVSAWNLASLTAAGKSQAILVISCAALMLNLALDLWWIPIYGGLGAAIATSATEIVVLLLACVVSARVRVR